MAEQRGSTLRPGKRTGAAMVFAGMLVGLLAWAALRDTAAEKEIQRRLADLRAAGEPVTAEDLAGMFPDPAPDKDAAALFASAFNLATNNPPPVPTPIVGYTLLPGRRIDEETRARLADYCAATAAITNLWPETVPPDARFAMRWHLGFTNVGGMDFGAVRGLMHLIVMHVLDAVEAGDSARAALMIERGFEFTRTVNYNGWLVTHMIRHACESRMCDATEYALNQVRFTEDQLRRLGAVLPFEKPGALRACLRSEHAFAIRAFQSVKAGVPLERLMGGAGTFTPWERLWRKFTRLQPDYSDADFALYLRMIPRRIELSEWPPLEAMRAMEELIREYDSRVVSNLADGIYPAGFKAAIGTHAETQARILALSAALAIERARLASNDEVPVSLEALAPRFLPAIPRDAIDGQSLRFVRNPKGYVVYSIGIDGVDNGGMARTNQPATARYDVTVTVTR